LPYIPDGTSIVALADMKEKNAVDVSGMKPGCQYIFTVASRNRHGYSKLSPISDLITTASTVPEAPATPGISHPSSTELTLHFIMPHDNGSKILKIFLIIREGKVIAKIVQKCSKLKTILFKQDPNSKILTLFSTLLCLSLLHTAML